MDWDQFERLVCEILAQDDLPRLRRVGGIADDGIDAVDEAFYLDEVSQQCVVQITSERAQVDKFRRTLKRLEEAKVLTRKIVIVYRAPLASQTRVKIVEVGAEQGIAVDPRDESYLVGKLGDLKNGLFARYFQDARTQADRLLELPDPLQQADSRLMRAVLASVGAYLIAPDSKLVRTTLFDRTVLAAIVEARGGVDRETLDRQLAQLLPGGQVDSERTTSAIRRLVESRQVTEANGEIVASEQAIASITAVLGNIKMGFDRMLGDLLTDVCRSHKLDDAAKGYLQRNLRRALTLLVRVIGPTDSLSDTATSELQAGERTFRDLLATNLPANVARTALSSMARFVQDKANTKVLAVLARTYAALAIRNLDPIGKRWQETVLSRSRMILDTDAVLTLLIEELPDHRAIRKAVQGLSTAGVRFLVPDFVLREVVTHVSRASVTYNRVKYDLLRRPPGWVLEKVWHAVVCGYYFSYNSGARETFGGYLGRYFSAEDGESLIRFRLSKVAPLDYGPLSPVHKDDEASVKALTSEHLPSKEVKRLKAEFREDDFMARRVEADITAAVGCARLDSEDSTGKARAYLISSDSLFSRVQRSVAWGSRPKVHIHTRALPEFAELVCGATLQDDELVNLLFNPVLAAAAAELDSEITALAKAGVNLRDVEPTRLEWDLSRRLQKDVLRYNEALSDKVMDAEQRAESGIELARAAKDIGYAIDPNVEELLRLHLKVAKKYAYERDRRERAVAIVKGLVKAAGATKKAQARVNRVLRELGGLEALEADDGDDVS